MSIIKTIDKKIKPNKAQYNLDRQNAKSSALLSGNVSKYEFSTGKDILPEKVLLEKAATIRRFEYFSLGKELQAQTGIAKKQYQTLGKIYESGKKVEATIKKCNKSNLIYSTKHSLYKYRDRKKFDNISFKSKISFLNEFLMI